MKSFLLKIIYISLVSVYMFTTVGICVISHYCDGELEEVSLFSDSTSCCEDGADDCCKNDSKHVVFQTNFLFSKAISELKTTVTSLFIVAPTFEYLASQINISKSVSQELANPPPNLIQSNIVSISVLKI